MPRGEPFTQANFPQAGEGERKVSRGEGPGICHHQVTIAINGIFPRHYLIGPHTPQTAPGFYSSAKLRPKPHDPAA